MDVPGFDHTTVTVSLAPERDYFIIRTNNDKKKLSTIVEVPFKADQKTRKVIVKSIKAIVKNGQVKITGMLEATNLKCHEIPVTAE